MSLMIRKDECKTGTRTKKFQDMHKQFNFKGISAVKCIMLRILLIITDTNSRWPTST